MFELKNLIQKDKPQAQIEAEKANPETKAEYHKQVMEVILERAEKILWENPNEGWPDLVQKILDAAIEVGAKPSAVQRKWVEETVQKWIDDVVKEIDAFKNLAQAENFLLGRDGKKPEEIDAQFEGNDEPWLLLEQNKEIQHALLLQLPTVNKDPEKFVFHSDHPPMIVIQCLDSQDYKELYKYKSVDSDRWKSTDGFVPMGSLFLDPLHPVCKSLNGCITIVRSESEETKVHEEQHLFYERYVETKKTQHLRAIDELAAYLKEGSYNFTPQGIFSHIDETSVVGVMKELYNPEWQYVVNQLFRLKYFGVPAESLWSRVVACEDLREVAKRLGKVKVDSEQFNFEVATQKGRSLAWVVENYSQLPEGMAERISSEDAEEQAKLDFNYYQQAEMNDAMDAMEKNENNLSTVGYDLDLLVNIWGKTINGAYFLIEAFPELKEKACGRKSFSNPDQKVSIVDRDVLERLRTAANYYSSVMVPIVVPEFSGTDTWEETIAKMEEFKDTLSGASSTQNKINQLAWTFRINQKKIPQLIEKHFDVKDFSKLSFSEAAAMIEELFSAVRCKSAETDNMKRTLGVLEEHMRQDWLDESEMFDNSTDTSVMDPFEAYEYFKGELAKLQERLAELYPQSSLNKPENLQAVVAAMFSND